MELNRSPKVTKLPSESHVAGVVLSQADFAGIGAGKVPFRGGLFTVASHCTSRLDQHSVRECWMIAQGQGQLTYDGVPLRVEQGDVLFFESMKSHQVHNDGDITLIISTVWWSADAL